MAEGIPGHPYAVCFVAQAAGMEEALALDGALLPFVSV